MLKLFTFFTDLLNLIAFIQLHRDQKKLVFYSEGKNYWVHLEALLKETLDKTDIPICYLSSSDEDPGLTFEHPRYQCFKIDDGFIRNWLFENIDTDVMVMTMPDLGQYQLKRSKYPVHYVYVQHSLVSFHMVYREGAFDCFDSIFCAGPHHIKEMRAIESVYKLPKKALIEHGYARLDAIIEESARLSSKKITDDSNATTAKHVLIAPSWGENGTVELGFADTIIGLLLELNYQVTFRPHPQTIIFFNDIVKSINSKYSPHRLFFYENNVAGQASLHASDIMISDWSGAALDYAFALNKPVLFIDVPRKINNMHYEELCITPIEVELRPILGRILSTDKINQCGDYIHSLLSTTTDIKHSDYIFNLGKSRQAGAVELQGICDKYFIK